MPFCNQSFAFLSVSHREITSVKAFKFEKLIAIGNDEAD